MSEDLDPMTTKVDRVYATPESLIKQRADSEDLLLPSGLLVLVRGLSRGEVFMLQKSRADGGIKTEQAWEQRMVALAMIQPKLTEDQVMEWQQGPAGGDMEVLTDKIKDLSKLGQGADKSGVPGTGDDA
jgi:hypothetical protein